MAEPTPAEVVRDRFQALAGQVHEADRLVREDSPDGIHRLRVAMRRVRSLLATFRALLPAEDVPQTERLRAELRWAAGELGGVRDLEVVHGELWVATGQGVLPGSVRQRLESHREQAGDAARRQVTHLLASERYDALLDEVVRVAAQMSWEVVTADAARERLRKDWRRLRRRVGAADALGPGADPELALHEVRKAAKRSRYAAEALAPALGDRAQRLAGVAEQVQDALGTHRDTLLTRRLLHRLGVDEPDIDAEHVFALGRLHAREERRGEEALYDYARACEEMDRKRHRRWLR